jgi:hypothetical protein
VEQPLHRSRRHEFPWGWACVVELAILAPLSAVLVLGVVPSTFDIESECVRGYGVVRTVGDSYLASFAVLGAVGWVGVVAATIYAHISERPRLATVVPIAWFAALVASSVVSGLAIGPATCVP